MQVRMELEYEWSGDGYVKLLEETIRGAYAKGADNIRDIAKQLVKKKSGDLASTIRARLAKVIKPGLHNAYVIAGDRKLKPPHYPKLRGIYWEWFVEFGTYWEPAHPFMRPAANRGFDPLMAEVEHTARRIINEERRAKAKSSQKRMKKVIA